MIVRHVALVVALTGTIATGQAKVTRPGGSVYLRASIDLTS